MVKIYSPYFLLQNKMWNKIQLGENQLCILYILSEISWFLLFQYSVDAGKHRGSQQIVARLMHTTLSVSYTQGRLDPTVYL